MRHVFENFLNRCTVVFGEPSGDRSHEFLAEYAEQLKAFSPDALRRGCDAVIRTHNGPQRWPRIAACIKACQDASEELALNAKPKPKDDPMWSREAFAFADRLMRSSPEGIKAARQGYALGCHEVCRQHRRLPTPSELERIRDTSEFVTRCAAGKMPMGVLHEPLQQLAQSILARREQCARRILGEAR